MTESGSEKKTRRGPLSRITNAAAGAIDVNSLVESVDVEAVAERIDVEGLVERIDVDAVADRIDIDALVRRIDLDALVQRIQVDDLIGRIDIDALVSRIAMDALLDRIDVNVLLDRVDPNRLLDRVDPDRLLDRVDPDRLLDRVDADRLLDRVDLDALIARVDLNEVLDRVDPDRLLDRVDANRLLDRVDLDRALDRVDIAAVVDRAGVSDIVGESTGQVAGSVLDAARRQLVSVDEIAGRIAFRLVGKDPRNVPEGPDGLMTGMAADAKGRGVITGHYAGAVSRFTAFLIDVGVVFGVYTLVASAVGFFASVILGLDIPSNSTVTVVGVLTLATWAFLYLIFGLVVSGGSVGKSMVGLKVVSRDGSPLTGRQAVLRVFVYPLSFIFLGLGLLGIAFGSRHLAWHDKIAHTCVVFDWGDRPAALPAPLTQWIASRE